LKKSTKKLLHVLSRTSPARARQRIKSFLLLFFKKEGLPFPAHDVALFQSRALPISCLYAGARPQDGPTMSENDKRGGEGPNTGVVVKARPKTRKPAMYKVLMLNDDYTPMEFVVHVLERFFQKTREEATRIMLHVHRRGVGVCGVFTYEVAETKVTQVMDLARQNQHPLQCTIEKD
jgi:ATP-dependent Clp protease adaptor protein ClpS